MSCLTKKPRHIPPESHKTSDPHPRTQQKRFPHRLVPTTRSSPPTRILRATGLHLTVSTAFRIRVRVDPHTQPVVLSPCFKKRHYILPISSLTLGAISVLAAQSEIMQVGIGTRTRRAVKGRGRRKVCRGTRANMSNSCNHGAGRRWYPMQWSHRRGRAATRRRRHEGGVKSAR